MNCTKTKVTDPRPPRYKVGDRQGALTVIQYLGHSKENPTTGRKRQNNGVHWFYVKCKCGEINCVNQPGLIKGRTTCRECAKESAITKQVRTKERKYGIKTKTETPADVPDFARLRW